MNDSICEEVVELHAVVFDRFKEHNRDSIARLFLEASARSLIKGSAGECLCDMPKIYSIARIDCGWMYTKLKSRSL